MTEMQLQYKPDFERARERWDALWDHEIIDRPCTCVTAAKVENPSGYSRIIEVSADFTPFNSGCPHHVHHQGNEKDKALIRPQMWQSN